MSVRLVHLSANGKDRDHMRRIARVPVMMPLTSSEIEDIAKQTARAAVQETLLTLGVNTNDPEAIRQMQRDFAYLRDWREASGTIKARGLMALTGIAVSGIVAAIWAAIAGKGVH